MSNLGKRAKGSSDPVLAKGLVESEHPRILRYLARRDPIMKNLIEMVGPCQLQPTTSYFQALARSIIAQQISTKAARSITARVEEILGTGGWTAEAVLRTSTELLRSAGLSSAKERSLRDLALHVQEGKVTFADIQTCPDEQVIERLIPVRGIGRWTAEMFLIFSLGRPDILPVADLGLRAGVQRHYGLSELPNKETLTALAEPWRPYRSVATWYIWKSVTPPPKA